MKWHVLDAGERENVLRVIGEVLSRFEEVDVGYVFGSFLRGEFRDVDVAILTSRRFSPYEEFKFAMSVARHIEKTLGYRFEVDVKPLRSSPIHFQYEVIRSGRPVFCKSEASRVKYEASVVSKYLDYKDALEWFDKQFFGVT